MRKRLKRNLRNQTPKTNTFSPKIILEINLCRSLNSYNQLKLAWKSGPNFYVKYFAFSWIKGSGTGRLSLFAQSIYSKITFYM